MKVLVASHSYSGNGAAIMLLAVLEHWHRDLGWTVDVVLDMEREVPPDLAKIGVNVAPTVVPEDYDFALVNTIVSAGFLETLGPRVPTVFWVHEGETPLWASRWRAAEWRQIFGFSNKIIFQGPWQAEGLFRSFLTGIPSHRIACVQNGLPYLPKGLVAKPRKNGTARIAFLGGLCLRKRPQDLVDAVLGLGRNNVECVFIGSMEGIEAIGSENVSKLKSRPDLFAVLGELDRTSALEYLASADVFCLPSADESQPIAPLEAAALGVPSVLTELPSYAGTWRHGRDCLLNPVGDVAMLRWNLRALLEDTTVHQRISDGAKKLLQRFSIETFFRRFDAELPI